MKIGAAEQGVIRAYKLENQEGSPPRIIIDPEAIGAIRPSLERENLISEFESLVCVDGAGCFLDYLRACEAELNDPEQEYPLFLEHHRDLSVLALVLAAVGLYSVVSYGVATRTNEFGIRMALGANSSDVFRMVLTSAAVNVGAGLVAGIILSIVFDKLSTRWVMESSRNPLILAGVTLILIAAAALACFVPARRAASVDPMEALRYE